MRASTVQIQGPTIEMIARRFSVLSDPLRLRLLKALRPGEKSVGMLVAEMNATPTNVSRHLSVLAREGLLHRRKQAQQVFYSVAEPEIHVICDTLRHSFLHVDSLALPDGGTLAFGGEQAVGRGLSPASTLAQPSPQMPVRRCSALELVDGPHQFLSSGVQMEH